MKIAVLLPNWIGDVVMATPTLRALRDHFGSSTNITGLMRPYVSEVLQGTNWLDNHILYDRRSKNRNLRAWSVLKKLRSARFDMMLLLPNSLSSGLLAWLSGASERIGYARYGRGPLLTKKLQPPRREGKLAPISAVDYFLALAEASGCSDLTKRVELGTLPGDESEADRILAKLGILGDRKLILLNNSGAFGGSKLWPNEYFSILARQVADEFNADVLVICGPAERSLAYEITRQANHRRVRSWCDDVPSIGPSKAVIRRADALVTTDSGPRHIAAAFNVPTVALFGPIEPRWSINYNPSELHLYKSLDCSPCSQHVCPLGHHRCMRDITPNEVLFTLRRQLSCRSVSAAA